jgi:GTP:adenosylcobinamide-phosphate guanylyltransferase
VNAIVLAGGRLGRPFAEAEAIVIKALLPVQGETLLARMIGALRRSSSVTAVAVVGPPEIRELCLALGADQFADERGNGPDNIYAGLESVGDSDEVIIASSDLPFILPQDIDDLARRAPGDADLAYAIVERAEFTATYPASGRMFVPLRDGRFLGGGIIEARPRGLWAIEPHLRRLFELRKRPLDMARQLGPGILLRSVLGFVSGGRLGPSSHDLQTTLERIATARGAIVRGCSPRIAFDIDTERDWRLACRIAAGDRAGGSPSA